MLLEGEWPDEVAATHRGRAGLRGVARTVADVVLREAVRDARAVELEQRLAKLEAAIAAKLAGEPWADGTRFEDGTGWIDGASEAPTAA